MAIPTGENPLPQEVPPTASVSQTQEREKGERKMEEQIKRLKDLAEFGITLRHKRGTCAFCGASTEGYSSGIRLDSPCRNCSSKQDQLWTPETAYIRVVERPKFGDEVYEAVIKIEGKFYRVTGLSGNWGSVYPYEGEAEHPLGGIGLGWWGAERIYKEQL